MNRDDEFELRLAEWLEDGPTDAPMAGVEAAIAHAWAHPRGHARWWPFGRRGARDRHEPDVPPTPVERLRPSGSVAWILVAVLLLLAIAGVEAVASRLLSVASLPDNGRLAFAYDGVIWTVSPDGGDTIALTTGTDTNATAPAWSPDGEWLAFRSTSVADSHRVAIEVARADGTDRRRLTGDYAVSDGPIAWSPDGRWVAAAAGDEEATHIVVVPTTPGGRVRTLDEIAGTWPAFSPRGDLIAFIGTPAGEGRHDLYVVDPLGGSPRRLTSPENLPGALLSHPVWVDAGGSIVVDAAVAVQGGVAHRLVAVHASGGSPWTVGPDRMWQDESGVALGPAVAPDGLTVAFDGEGALWTTAIGSSRASRLDATSGTPSTGRPGPGGIAWSPDGSRVAWLAWALCASLPGSGDSGTACLASLQTVDPASGATRVLWTAPPARTIAAPSFSWDLSWQPVLDGP